jgi:hypothetical protein
MVRQPEVVVRRKVDHDPPVEPRSRARRPFEDPRMQQETLLVQVGEPLLQVVEGAGHGKLTLSHYALPTDRPTEVS